MVGPEAGPRLTFPVRLIIYGRPEVKKSSKEIARRGRGGTPFIVSSKRYRAWEDTAVLQLRSEWRSPPIGKKQKLHVAVLTFVGAGQQRGDLDGRYAGPLDALELAGVIENDSQIYSHDGSRIYRDRERPRVELLIDAYQD